MSTSFTIGFASKPDKSDFSGVNVNYDGYPDAVIPTFLWLSRFGKFSDLVKAIKNTSTGVRVMRSADEILRGEDIFELFNRGERALGRDDFFTADYSYLIHNNESITYYTSSSDRGTTIKMSQFDWNKIKTEVFDSLFSMENKRNILYMALYHIDSFKNIK